MAKDKQNQSAADIFAEANIFTESDDGLFAAPEPAGNMQPRMSNPLSPMPTASTDRTAISASRPPTEDRRQSRREGGERVTYNILSHLGALSTSKTGWKREVNIVSWNGRQPRLDIRDWDPQHMKMSRGVGLNGPETENLIALLQSFDYRRAGI